MSEFRIFNIFYVMNLLVQWCVRHLNVANLHYFMYFVVALEIHILDRLSSDTVRAAAHLCQAALVPCPLEALVPVWGHVSPEDPQSVQVLHLSRGRLPREQHAGVQQPS